MKALTFASVALAGIGMACGGGDGGGGGEGSVQCDSVPVCYAAAMADLRSCVPESDLILGSVTVNSRVVQGLRCTGTDVSVSFSDFSESETGTVPIPSRITFNRDGALCAEISRSSTGRILIERPGEEDVSVSPGVDEAYISCGPMGSSVLHVAANDDLGNCPSAVQTIAFTRDADITEMAVRLNNADGSQENLFVCQ